VTALYGRLGVLAAIGAMALKRELAERAWFWMQLVVRLVTMVVLAHFWRAVYAGTDRLGGLKLQQTLDYALLAQVLAPLSEHKLIVTFAHLLRSGDMAIVLLRPVDLQASEYAINLARLILYEAFQLPLLLVAWTFLGLHLPGDPLTWAAFAVTLLLGHAVLFFADWLLACLAFYTTDAWGIGVVRHALSTFFGGALVPLAMLPGWLQEAAAALPFAQGIAAPTLVLAGVTPLSGLPAVWGLQLAWLTGLWLVSRLAFARAVRQVTVHGG
jgi:ABC-2 type transport system permease protein